MSTNQPPSDGDSDHARRLSRLIEDVVARRLAGETVSDDALVASHPFLMPALGVELAELRRVELARHKAGDEVSATSDTQCEALLEPIPDAGSFPSYTITREIHRGGQGVVYQAIHKATKRKVAVKVMREGPFAGPRDRARFEREVHVLARLSHPNIVTIHDSGVAEGCHYFVMDYIVGQQLDAYLAERERPVDEVLKLFAKICEAVNAAQLRGVIHRDLKPSNIRVDPNGEPHILDFGLAKIAGGETTDESEPQVMSVTGQFIGSLPWASPEQAEGVPEKIDLRTDVYALGVMLYQALTGRFPYEVIGHIRDILDNILKCEPAKPSTIRRQINDEIETIVLKCLNKDRDRRYQTAGELARDIQRYLCGDPIEAKRDSGWYVLKKLARRHKSSAVVTIAFAILITASAILLASMYGKQGELLVAADDAKAQAKQEAATARIETRKANRIKQFVTEMLRAVVPDESKGRKVTVREVLDKSSKTARSQLSGEPEVLGAVLDTIGLSYLALGDFDRAEVELWSALELRRATFGAEHADLADSLNNFGSVLYELGRYREAERLLESALSMRRHLLGPEHPSVGETLVSLGGVRFEQRQYETAEINMREGLEIQQRAHGIDHEKTTPALNLLAILLKTKGNLDEAEPMARKVIEMRIAARGKRNSFVTTAMNNLADVLFQKGDLDDAEALHTEILKIKRGLYGSDHTSVAKTLYSLAGLLEEREQWEAAEARLIEAVEIFRERLQPTHRDLIDALRALGNIQRRMGKLDEAGRTLAEVLQRARRSSDNEEQVANASIMLGMLKQDQGELEAALPLLQEAARIRHDILPADHWHIANADSAVGACLVALARYAEAEPLLVGAYEQLNRVRPGRSQTGRALNRVIALYEAWGKPEQAERFRAMRDGDQPG